MPKVCVAILNYNGKHYLQQFLPKLLETDYHDFEILIGDNASQDKSIEYLSAQFSNQSNVRWVQFEENHGFAGGYNQLFKHISSEFTVLLNSDILVDPDWLKPIITLLEQDSSIGACQPFIHSFKKPDYFEHAGAAGGYMDKYGFVFCMGRIFFSTEKVETSQYTFKDNLFWVSGAAMTVRTEVFKQLKGFDADFFAHMEEIDLCWRMQLQGYKLANCPESRVYHVGGGTLEYESPFKVFLNFRNNIYMLQKNIPNKLHLFKVMLLRQIFDFAALLRFLFEGKPKHAQMVLKAHYEVIKNLSKTNAKRSEVQSNTKNTSIKGIYRSSIVFDYFLRGKKSFKNLNSDLFSQ
jgi:GT2 family glycosyltransferase